MTTALVLSGGGARGAYEAGVLRFLTNEIGPRLDKPLAIDIISGTSVGALNGCWIAGNGTNPGSGRGLSHIWRRMEVGDIWSFDSLDLLRSPAKLWQADPDIGASFLDARPLHDLVRRLFPFAGIRRALGEGTLAAVALSATEVATGRSTLFIEGAGVGDIPYPQVRVREVTLGPEHALASAAIPFLFPPINVDGLRYVDGSLRQNTPLSPALRMGADKVLVIGVKRPFDVRSEEALADANENPNLVFLLGKVLNALMLDPLEQDLTRLDRLNAIFDWGTENYGVDFIDRFNAVISKHRGRGYRRVESALVLPRADLGEVCAAAYVAAAPRLTRATRLLLDLISDREGGEADLMSYLFFDRSYTAEIERLGWEDARDCEEQLATFFR
ncbi:MAG TPA: patatin-like phospholipase family protein [Myxococcota bacterium]|nr:patatin-like phospholipase family protein [Myxococcota bacterium]